MLGLLRFATTLVQRPILTLLATGVATRGFGLAATTAMTAACTPVLELPDESEFAENYKRLYESRASNLQNHSPSQFAAEENDGIIIAHTSNSGLFGYNNPDTIPLSPPVSIMSNTQNLSTAYEVWYVYSVRPRGAGLRTCGALFTFPANVTISEEGDFDILAQSTTQENISDQLNHNAGSIPPGCEMVF